MACLPCARQGRAAVASCDHDVRVPLYQRIAQALPQAVVELEVEMEVAHEQAEARMRARARRPALKKEQWPSKKDCDRTRRAGAKGPALSLMKDNPFQ